MRLRRTYDNNPKLDNGQYTNEARPEMVSTGTAPKYRESCDSVRLSPITHTEPSGTL